MKMKMIRETTKYTDVDFRVPQHDYLVEGGLGGRMIAYRKEGSDLWEKFRKPVPFSKKHRSFKELREPLPTEFVAPRQSDPWKNKSYTSLEAFM